MGLSKEQKALYNQMTQLISEMRNPKSNPAQDYLTQSALDAANQLKSGDYTKLPKGMFFDFQSPIEKMKQFDNYSNVGKEGRYALGDSGGESRAIQLAGDYRKNLLQREASNSFQDDVRNAYKEVQGALGQAAGAKSGNDSSILGALQGLYSSTPKKDNSWISGLMNVGTSLLSFL